MFPQADLNVSVRLRQFRVQDSLRSHVSFLRLSTWKHKDKRRPRGRLHSDAQVKLQGNETPKNS